MKKNINLEMGAQNMDKHITTPITAEVTKNLKSGDYVYITGTIYVARDAAHKRMIEALERGENLPIDIKDSTIYYMGPSPAREGRPIGSAGPTTATRMDKYAPTLLDLGEKAMIGKGKRSKEVIDAIVRNHAVYFAAVGGAGALLSKCITKSEIVCYEDLGAEAIRKLQVKDFPVIVVIDSDVNSSMVSCRIGTNNLQAGVKAAEAALAVGEDELYIGIVNYDVNSANGQQRELGFRQTVEQDPRVKDITTINVLSTTEDARTGAKEMLLSDSRINVVVTFNDWTSLGVGWAIRDLDRGDRTQVVAFDSNVVSVGMLETGEVDALIVQNPYAMGYLGVETAANLINGQTGGPSVIDTATTIVTRENMYERESQKILFSFEERK